MNYCRSPFARSATSQSRREVGFCDAIANQAYLQEMLRRPSSDQRSGSGSERSAGKRDPQEYLETRTATPMSWDETRKKHRWARSERGRLQSRRISPWPRVEPLLGPPD